MSKTFNKVWHMFFESLKRGRVRNRKRICSRISLAEWATCANRCVSGFGRDPASTSKFQNTGGNIVKHFKRWLHKRGSNILNGLAPFLHRLSRHTPFKMLAPAGANILDRVWRLTM